MPNRGAIGFDESGLLAPVIKSRKSEAQKFRQWVTGVVLSAIRKDGSYVVGEEKLATGGMTLEGMTLRVMQLVRQGDLAEPIRQDRQAVPATVIVPHVL